MKKTFAVLMLVAMLITGCGNNAMDGAKKDAQEAAQKVEQTANEAKDAANKAADDAAAKVDEAKDAATAKAEEVKADADKMMSDAADKMDSMVNEGRTIALSGMTPGSTSIEDIQAMYGEATAVEGNVMTFVDGLKVTLDDAKKTVKEISTTGNAFETPEGIYVGADEYLLNEYCGMADSVRKVSDGVEYEYNGGDKKSKVVYKSADGVITEIKCLLNN